MHNFADFHAQSTPAYSRTLIKDCGVNTLKMSDFGYAKSDMRAVAENSMFVMSGNYALDRKQLTLYDVVAILEKSYK